MKNKYWAALLVALIGAGVYVLANETNAQPIPQQRATQTVRGAGYDAIFNQCLIAEEYGNQAKSILHKGGDYSNYLTWVADNTLGYNGADMDHLRMGVGPQVGRVVFKEKFDGDVFAECMKKPARFDISQ